MEQKYKGVTIFDEKEANRITKILNALPEYLDNGYFWHSFQIDQVRWFIFCRDGDNYFAELM